MAIVKPTKKRSLDEVIAGAPDAGLAPSPVPTSAPTSRKRIMKGEKEQITVLLPPNVIDAIETRRRALGITRSTWINLAIQKALETQI